MAASATAPISPARPPPYTRDHWREARAVPSWVARFMNSGELPGVEPQKTQMRSAPRAPAFVDRVVWELAIGRWYESAPRGVVCSGLKCLDQLEWSLQ